MVSVWMRPASCEMAGMSALHHQLGAALPAVAAALGRIARVEREVAGLHIQLPRFRGLAGFGQRGVQRLLQLALHDGRVAAFAGGREDHRQLVLGHLDRGTGRLRFTTFCGATVLTTGDCAQAAPAASQQRSGQQEQKV
jgi:hypothetical protein